MLQAQEIDLQSLIVRLPASRMSQLAIDPTLRRDTARAVLGTPVRLAIFDADGTLVAVLGVASVDQPILERSCALTGAVADGTLAVQLDKAVPPPPARGGLSPRALRRVREYIDTHLEEATGLKDLADIAGLSMFHFARAFKQSQGVTPNCYLFQRRVEHAQKILAETDMPMSEIAMATGFSDQSHFARRFREHFGTTPAKFRWSKR